MPVLVARQARQDGRRVVAAAIHGITDPTIEAHVDRVQWLHWGDLPAFFSVLDGWRRDGITEAILAGKVEQQVFPTVFPPRRLQDVRHRGLQQPPEGGAALRFGEAVPTVLVEPLEHLAL